MMIPRYACQRTLLAALLALGASASPALCQTNRARELVVDATQRAPAVDTGFLRIGTNRSPTGHTIGVTNRYLTRDGKPWLPVMGEFHFSRYPEDEWENEILKMKAGGVQIISTYIIWIHHEEVEGVFDWTGRRDLRRFVQLVAKHGMFAYPRIGPWSHAEVRNGGFPDWLLERVKGGVRSNDSTYLAYVAHFYDQIAQQLRGLLWKEGGPVIGIQLENEYTPTGPGRGPDHIVRLKQLAVQAGFDVPLYTVTGWDGATFPPAEVIPVFGGYMDMPWDQSIEELPPNEVYGFRFANRVAGGMGAQWPNGTPSHTSTTALAQYPFLGAEYGGAIQVTYHRRPVIGTDDVAAMLPVQLGSGVNLYGYYMFHGGVNPRGKLTTLQESQRTGYPTDPPVKSYDFQAPLGEYGEVRPSFRRLKSFHYFLNDFGGELAPMVVHAPDVTPTSLADTSQPRFSVRTLDDRGFIFFSNYLRIYSLPRRRAVQVVLRLPNDTLRVPRAPVDVPSGAYFIWPVNLDVGQARLTYSTAQLLARVSDATGPVYFFFNVPGIPSEFAFESTSLASVEAPGGTITRSGKRTYVTGLRTGLDATITIHESSGPVVRIVLLSREQADNSWRGTVAGTERLVVSAQSVFFDGERIHLRTEGEPNFSFAVFPALPVELEASASIHKVGASGLFTRYTATLLRQQISVQVTKVRDATPVPPVTLFNAVTWRKVKIALAPNDSAFDRAAEWRVGISLRTIEGLSNAYLRIRYAGDVARIYSGTELIDDDYFKGTPWSVGLKRLSRQLDAGPLTLRVLPLRTDAPVYIPPRLKPRIPAGGQLAKVDGIDVIPEYELIVGSRAARP
jgi:beta-galactosidase